HPYLPPGIGELRLHIAHIRIVELVEIKLSALRTVVPPDRVGIALHEFEEALDDRLLAGVASRATVGVRVSAAIKEIKQPGREILESLVAQRPCRRPIGLLRRV